MGAAFISAEIVWYKIKKTRKPINPDIFAFWGINPLKTMHGNLQIISGTCLVIWQPLHWVKL